VQKWYVEQKNQGCVAGSQIQQALAFFIEALRTAVFLDFSSTSSTTTTDKIIRPKQEQQQQQQQQLSGAKPMSKILEELPSAATQATARGYPSSMYGLLGPTISGTRSSTSRIAIQ
jgi:hypothetical protein